MKRDTSFDKKFFQRETPPSTKSFSRERHLLRQKVFPERDTSFDKKFFQRETPPSTKSFSGETTRLTAHLQNKDGNPSMAPPSMLMLMELLGPAFTTTSIDEPSGERWHVHSSSKFVIVCDEVGTSKVVLDLVGDNVYRQLSAAHRAHKAKKQPA
jgi:hypothetical protein